MHAPRLRSLLCPSEGGANSCQQDPHSPSLPSPSCVSQVAPPPLVEPLEVSSGPTEGGDPAVGNTVASCLSPRLKTPPDFPPRPFSPPLQPVAVDSGAAGGGGARVWGAELGVAKHGGADLEVVALGVPLASAGGPCSGGTGGIGAGGSGAGGAGAGGRGAGGAGARGAGAGGAAAGGAGGTGAGGTGASGTRGSGEQQSSTLHHLVSLPHVATEFPVTGTTPPLMFPPPNLSQAPLPTDSPLPDPSRYSPFPESLTERREPESCASSPATSPVRARASCARPHPVPSEDTMALRSSSVAQRLVQPSPPESSLSHVPDPESDLVHATSPIVTHVLTTLVIDHTFESAAASALVAELVDFAAAFHLDYFASLVSKSESDYPPSVGGELALGCDVIEDRQFELKCLVAAVPHLASMLLASEGVPDALDILTPRSYAELITSPYSSQWQTVMDAEMASWNSTSNYIDAIPPPRANIVNGMWIFRVKRPPGSPSVFKARYAARVFSQCLGVDFFQNFSPTPKIATIWVLLHVAEQCDNELHSLDFSTTFLQGSLHEEI
ncbi:unnamed protein product [Closterium sp. NIES-54]